MIWSTSLSPDRQTRFDRLRFVSLAVVLTMLLASVSATGTLAFGEGAAVLSERQVAEDARAAWDRGATAHALELLDQGIRDHPQASMLHKLRGDILATFRGPLEAVQAYDRVLAERPATLDARWAKWSVLVWWGQAEKALAELRRIAQLDSLNPLIHLKLAQELRKVDRLEESLESYEQAVRLMPGLLGWRLALARARFDLLDYQGAEEELRSVLQQLAPGSPLEIPAKNQLAQLYESMERGRRFTPVLTPGATSSQLREWAAIRADAWKLFVSGRFQEAEPMYRKMLTLNPQDSLATHHLGITLMQLGRCKEALAVFGNLSNLDPSEEDYADAIFRMGQCLVEMERWEDAFVHFQTLYDAAVEFEEANKHVALPAGTRVLSKEKLAKWLDTVRPHIPELAKLEAETSDPGGVSVDRAPSSELSEAALYKKAVERVKPQNILETGAGLMGRDADFSWFQFVIPAGKVVRDDFPTGAHDFIPLNPTDTFPITQPDIFLVFRLVSPSYDAVPLTARCGLETSESTGQQRVITQDRVMTSMNDQSGYFMLSPPETGWTPGLYRCGLFSGEGMSAYTLADEVRFRIMESHESTLLESPKGGES
jgi:tetratricopeptide (TPR) repeat protein